MVTSSYSSTTTWSTLASLRDEYFDPYILAPLQSLVDSSTKEMDLISILALMFIAFVSFKVLDYVRRVVMWWIALAFKLVLLLVIVQLGFYVHSYGWEKTLRDAGWLWGILEGFLIEQGPGTAGMKGNVHSGGRRSGRQQIPVGNKYPKGRWS